MRVVDEWRMVEEREFRAPGRAAVWPLHIERHVEA